MSEHKEQIFGTHEVEFDSDLNQLIVEGIQDVKGKAINILDLKNLEERPADYFIICEGDSKTQVRAITESIRRIVKNELGETPSIEGTDEGKWIVLDFFDTVVHIFHPELREFYQLDYLWGDAPSQVIADIEE